MNETEPGRVVNEVSSPFLIGIHRVVLNGPKASKPAYYSCETLAYGA